MCPRDPRAEFFITGNSSAIVRIIDVLAWEDRFKKRLNDWMFSKHSKKQIERLDYLLTREMGLDVEVGAIRINYQGDMDNIFAMFSRQSGDMNERSNPMIEIRKILGITDEDLMYMAVKGAAMRSLQANSRVHPKVLETCRTEMSLRDDKAKFELAVINELEK